MYNTTTEQQRSPRQNWMYATKIVLEGLKLLRSMNMSGRRFEALLAMAKKNQQAQIDGSFSAAVGQTNQEEDTASVSPNLLAGCSRILRRVPPGSRDDVQLDLILSAFPLLKEIENEKTARLLCQAMKIKTVPAQQIIIAQKTLGKEMVGVLSGSLRLVSTTDTVTIERHDDGEEVDEGKEGIEGIEAEEAGIGSGDSSGSSDEDDMDDDKEEHDPVVKRKRIKQPPGIILSVLKPGDLITRSARSIHLFEALTFGFTGRDPMDDEMVNILCLCEHRVCTCLYYCGTFLYYCSTCSHLFTLVHTCSHLFTLVHTCVHLHLFCSMFR
jgi:hypothetical protein